MHDLYGNIAPGPSLESIAEQAAVKTKEIDNEKKHKKQEKAEQALKQTSGRGGRGQGGRRGGQSSTIRARAGNMRGCARHAQCGKERSSAIRNMGDNSEIDELMGDKSNGELELSEEEEGSGLDLGSSGEDELADD